MTKTAFTERIADAVQRQRSKTAATSRIIRIAMARLDAKKWAEGLWESNPALFRKMTDADLTNLIANDL